MGKKKLFSNKKNTNKKKINSVQLLVITALALKVYCFGKSPREPFLTSSVLPVSGVGGSRGCRRGPGSLPPGPSRCFRAGAAGKSSSSSPLLLLLPLCPRPPLPNGFASPRPSRADGARSPGRGVAEGEEHRGQRGASTGWPRR